MDNRSLNLIDFSQAFNAVMSMDVKFLLHVTDNGFSAVTQKNILLDAVLCLQNKVLIFLLK